MSSISDHPRATTALSTIPFHNHRPSLVMAASAPRTGGKPTNPLKAIMAGMYGKSLLIFLMLLLYCVAYNIEEVLHQVCYHII